MPRTAVAWLLVAGCRAAGAHAGDAPCNICCVGGLWPIAGRACGIGSNAGAASAANHHATGNTEAAATRHEVLMPRTTAPLMRGPPPLWPEACSAQPSKQQAVMAEQLANRGIGRHLVPPRAVGRWASQVITDE